MLGLLEADVEVRDAAGALHEVHQLPPARQVCAQQEMVVTAEAELQHTGVVLDDDRAPVDVTVDALDARDRARREVVEQRRPVELPDEREP